MVGFPFLVSGFWFRAENGFWFLVSSFWLNAEKAVSSQLSVLSKSKKQNVFWDQLYQKRGGFFQNRWDRCHKIRQEATG
jgi:hypothetical protein